MHSGRHFRLKRRVGVIRCHTLMQRTEHGLGRWRDLLVTATMGWWGLNPLAALAVLYFIAQEGRECFRKREAKRRQDVAGSITALRVPAVPGSRRRSDSQDDAPVTRDQGS